MFVALLALTFLAYAPGLRAAFVSDDQLAIVDNEWVTGAVRPVGIFESFSWWGSSRADAPGYRPLVTLSFALDHAFIGLNLGWFHGVNFVWHALVSALVGAIAVRLGATRRAAVLGALAFCLLPVHSEAVIWAVGRAELMAAAGFAAALLVLLDFRNTGKARHLWLASVLFLAALFAKENAVTLLAVPAAASLVLPAALDARRRDAIATLVLVACLAAYVAVRSAAGPLLDSVAGDRLDNPISTLTLIERPLACLSVLGRYLALSSWPHPLSVDYSYDALGIRPGFRGDRYTVLAVVACIALATAAWRTRRRVPAVAFGLAVALITYSIVSNAVVLIGTAMAERLFYLPSFGLCIAAAPALATVSHLWRRRGSLLLVGLACCYAVVSFARASEWRSPVSLFESATRAYPRSARAQMELASAYGRVGRVDDAVAASRRATDIMPGYAAAWYNLGNLYARNQRFDMAEPAYRTALSHAPRLVAARYNLGLVLLATGRPGDAVEILAPGLEIAPRDSTLAMTLADAYFTLGRNNEAAEAYARVLEAEPAADTARLRRAIAVQRASGCEAALPEYLELLRRVPGDVTALAQATECLRASGQSRRAEELAERARVANRRPGR